ncbi:hypothetical protein BKA70DRAFT_1426104 [Coprinopsis sp. MPI-PUGE-AT-0042]|nr:hypothetical protein BKA70DRAFT_1426104 [Coprinopsis sp. MPI-PUGE-AT-0042]
MVSASRFALNNDAFDVLHQSPSRRPPAPTKRARRSTKPRKTTVEDVPEDGEEQRRMLEERRMNIQREIDEAEKRNRGAQEQAEMGEIAALFHESLDLLKQAGFPDVFSWMKTFWTSNDQHVSAHASRFTANHGTEILDFVYTRQPEATMAWTQTALGDSIRKDGERLIDILAPSASVSSLL